MSRRTIMDRGHRFAALQTSGATKQRASADFHHRVADHAASGALRDLLEHHRLSYAPEPLSEGTIFGLSGRSICG